MKRIHLLQVDGEADEYVELIEALGAEGMRVGWLDFGGSPVPSALTAAAGSGVLRAVAVCDGLTIAVKPRRGQAVMKDLLREYFVGCSVVLVRGAEGLPRLEAADGHWQLEVPGAATRTLDTSRLVATLRKPSPFGT